MNDFILKVNEHYNLKLPFVIYRKPNEDNIIGVFQSSDELFLINNFSEAGIVFCSFNENQRFIIPSNQSETIIFKNNFKVVELENQLNYVFEETKLDFEKLVNKGILAIKNKEFQKVVLSRKEVLDLNNFDVIETFTKLVTRYKSAFRYCFFHPKIGLWFGATPEQLLKVSNENFATVSLAGTQKYENSTDVVWQEKEIEEQRIVTDFIVQNLKNANTEIEVSEPKTVQAGNLIHLKSIISGKLNVDFNLKDCIESLHPTPAICGMPRQESKKFILENEKYDREFYSGFIGELNIDKQTDVFVNLRCMKINKNKANIFVGCGITRDSIAEKEFQETVNKSMTMKILLNC